MSQKRLAVGVIMGGVSTEHDVSMHSGSMMLRNLDPQRFQAYPIIITRANEWLWPVNTSAWDAPGSEYEFLEQQKKASPGWHRYTFPCFGVFPQCDIFLLGLHGTGGEDGKLQGFLDLCGRRYTGSGCLASALAMDKIKSKEMYVKSGIRTPGSLSVNPHALTPGTAASLADQLGFPLVVKPSEGGSSLGVSVVHSLQELQVALSSASAKDGPLLIETFISGREATCGFIENFKPLPPTEIIPLKDSFFNYEAKYDSERTREVTPADFPESITRELQALAKKCHQVLGLSVYSRTDFIIRDGVPFVLETNNLPGFTGASILPQQAAAAGLSYKDLLSKVIDESLIRFRQGSAGVPE